MRKDIGVLKSSGKFSRQAHTDLPEGTFEREMGRGGFFGPVTHLYHRRPPTSWSDIQGPLSPRLFNGEEMFDGQLLSSSSELLVNRDARFGLTELASSMTHLVRNSDGDNLFFVHAGVGLLFCDFGTMDISEGDYVLLPRGTMFRIETTGMKLLTIEATGSRFQIADRGILGPNALFDPAVFQFPEIDERFTAQADEATDVWVKVRQQWSRMGFPHNPLDAVGWKGDNLVCKLNWRDLCPLMSHKYHLPPSAHTTFVARGFVVCTFVPRPFETAPSALKVPFYHSNEDYDEVLFYHQGDFFSRDNIDPGAVTLHPAGFPHGPHPKAMKNAFEAKSTMTNEVAVMIDTEQALDIADKAESVEVADYKYSWRA